MKQTRTEMQFLKDLDNAQVNPDETPGTDQPEEYREALALAKELSRVDFSQESRVRLPMRVSLVERTAQRSPSRLFSQHAYTAVKWALGITILVLFAISLSWIFTHLAPTTRQPASGEAPTPSVTPIQPLTLDTPMTGILQRMSLPLWNAVWVSGSDTTFDQDGQPQTTYTQAWLDRNGRGRVIVSDAQNGIGSDPMGLQVRWVWVGDGQNMAAFDLSTGTFDSDKANFGYALHPLENSSDFMQLLFPFYLTGRGGTFAVEGEEVLLDRNVLVIAWRPDASSPVQDRLWVDALSGFLLRRVRMLENGSVVEDVQVGSVEFETPLPDDLAGSGGIETAQFTKSSQQVEIPQGFLPLPTPIPYVKPTVPAVEMDSTTLVLEPVSDPVYAGEPDPGDLYLSMRKPGATVDQVIRIDDVCLASETPNCPVVIEDYPTLAWSPLFWSPDGSQAVFMDSNNTRLLHFDPLTRQWSTLMEPIYATTQVLYWAPNGAWMAVTLQDGIGGESSLVTLLSPEGAGIIQVAPDLGGTQIPVGWLDDDHLLFTRFKDVPKGQVGTREEPRLYMYELPTGTWTEMAIDYQDMYPVLSPDRTRMAVSSRMNDQEVINIYDFAIQTISHASIPGMNPVWSLDNQRLSTVRWSNGIYEVYVVTLEPNGEVQEEKVFEWAGYPVVTWSPEGNRLIIEASPSGDQLSSSLYVVSLPDLNQRELVLEGEDEAFLELRYPSFRP